MRNILVLIFILIPLNILAQESIGFTDSTDFKYLIDYRLPDWGYSNFYISSGNLNVSNRISSTDRNISFNNGSSPINSETKQQSFNSIVSVSPTFEIFRESEDFQYSASSQLRILSNLSNRKDMDKDLTNASEIDDLAKDRSNRMGYNLFFSARKYLSEDIFLQGGLSSDFEYRFSKSSREINNTETRNVKDLDRELYFSPTIGIGFGRLRNVTPVIRALRANERYKALGNPSLNNDDLIYAAEHFTRFNGYQQGYDRPLKYFWEDLNTGIDGKLDALDTYDMFYLNDVFNENLGTRLEGYRVSLNAGFSANNSMDRREDELNNFSDRNTTVTRNTIINVTAEWYKNLTLDHQISANLITDMYLPMEKRFSYDWNYSNNIIFGWLWVLNDRFMLNNSASNIFLTQKVKELDQRDRNRFNTNFNSSLTYFIENSLALTANLNIRNNYQHRFKTLNPSIDDYSETNSFWDFSLSAGIRYYFNRNLF
tara:strand:+ start:12283 stop:13734 length:1452 start_codon:yes stop_codon:yes gene_type:complete